MSETIVKVLRSLENEMNKRFKKRVPEPNETPEDTEIENRLYEADFFMEESFKLGFLLALEITKK